MAPTTITVDNTPNSGAIAVQLAEQRRRQHHDCNLGNWTTSARHAARRHQRRGVRAAGPTRWSGDGAVGQLIALGITTIDAARSRRRDAAERRRSSITAARSTLAGGAVLSAQQETIVGGSGAGLLVLMGGALAL